MKAGMKHIGFVTRCGVGLLICAVAILLIKFFMARAALRNQPYSPDDGSIVRSQIYDAIWQNRPQNHPYFLHSLIVQGDWAIADAGIQQGADGNIAATLQRVNGKWSVVYSFFHDDVPTGEEFSDNGRLKDFPAGLALTVNKKWSFKKRVNDFEETQHSLDRLIEESKRVQDSSVRIMREAEGIKRAITKERSQEPPK